MNAYRLLILLELSLSQQPDSRNDATAANLDWLYREDYINLFGGKYELADKGTAIVELCLATEHMLQVAKALPIVWKART